MSARNNSRRVAGAFAALAVGVTMAAPQVVADSATTRGGNGPETCVAFDAQGNVRELDAGDCAQFGKAGQGRSNAKARNVILIIGDGMGQSEITSARNYLEGAGGRFAGLDNLTSEGLYTHHSINKDGSFNYVTDSAASGTAWATGTKTYNGAIGVGLKGTPKINLIEQAKNAGLRTGNVSTAEIQDATPAVLGAHVAKRSSYAPSGDKKVVEAADARENGGLGSISEQIVDTRADVTLGGGASYFDTQVKINTGNTNPFLEGDAKYPTTWVAGKTVLENAKDNGYQVVTTADELAAVKEANQDSPVLGLFSPGNMKTTFASSTAKLGASKQAPISCQTQDIGTEPEMALMTRKAIELLDDPTSDKGFFLQVESASIDKRDHSSDACGQIGETKRLDEAVKEALDFAKRDGNTLVVVTADHSHTSQIVGDNRDNVALTTRLLTADKKSTMTIAYGTTPVAEDGTNAGSQQHTGAQLRVAAYGPGEENVLGQTDQTDLFYTVLNALDLNPDKSDSATDANLAKPASSRDVVAVINADGSIRAPQPGDFTQYGPEGQQRVADGLAKNAVLFIGDGMGDSELTSARNYLYGANGRLPGIDNLDYTGSYTHFSVNKDGTINYVTDSAASGTGWATGTKTYNGALGVGIDGKPVQNLAEKAKAKGLKIGNVSTAEVQDATPAAIGSHVAKRSSYAPSGTKKVVEAADARENGGRGSISEQLIDSRFDVLLGGGAQYFDTEVQVSGMWAGATKWEAGKSVLENAKNNGFQVVTTADELAAVTAADQHSPLIGLFSPGNMPRNFLETIPTEDGYKADTAAACQLNPARTAEIPSLSAMTTKAMDLLANENGFFLQVEGASIDKADHDGDACGQIGELDDLDQAVQAAQAWVKKTGEPTLIVVTADHAHTSQITAVGADTAGLATTLLTADGDPMTLSYNNSVINDPKADSYDQGHTGAQLRVAASGPGAENVIGRTDQTDLHYTVLNALGVDTESAPVADLFIPAKPAPEPTDEPTTEPTGEPTAEPKPVAPMGKWGFFYVDQWGKPAADRVINYGDRSDEVLFGDWDGNGTDTPMVHRGNKFLGTNGWTGVAQFEFTYGDANDRVIVGDWDGDGRDSIAVVRGNQVLMRNALKSGVAERTVTYGNPTDTILAGNFDADLASELVAVRGNTFYVQADLANGKAAVVFAYGDNGDEVVIGDWNGDGADGVGVVRGNKFLLRNDLSNGVAQAAYAYGDPTDGQFVGDWNADGVDTPMVDRR